MIYAVCTEPGTVTNIIVADSLEQAEVAVGSNCVVVPEGVSCAIGDFWDGQEFYTIPARPDDDSQWVWDYETREWVIVVDDNSD